MTTVGLVPCPLGSNCLSGTTQGHDPSGKELAQCQARAKSPGAAAPGADMRPASAYSPQTAKMQKLQWLVKRAWGSDGRGIPNLVGPPGIGKSEFAKSLSEQMGADFMVFDVSAKDPDCLSGIPYNPDERTPEEEARFAANEHVFLAGRLYDKDVVDIFYRDDRSDKPMVVFFDEINGGKGTLLSSLQKVMTSKELPETGKRMNPNVFMMAAMNDADHTSNGTELAPAMVSRLTPIEFKPNFEEWLEGERSFWGKDFDELGIDESVSAMGDVPPTREQYLEAVTHVGNYLKELGNPEAESGASKNSTNLFSMPPNEEDYSIKVGQPRSWSKTISNIAAAIANPPPGEDKPSSHDLANIVKINCGAEAAENFSTYYEQHQNLPDIDEAMASGTLGDSRKQWKSQGRPDIPMFAIDVISGRGRDGDVETINQALTLVGEIAEEYPDMVASKMPKVVEGWKDAVRAKDDGERTNEKKFNAILAEQLRGNQALVDAFGRSASSRASSSGAQTAIDAAMGQAQKAARKRQEASS